MATYACMGAALTRVCHTTCLRIFVLPLQQYRFEVAAVCDGLSSRWSFPSQPVTIQVTAPSAPTITSVEVQGADVAISFNQPTDDGGSPVSRVTASLFVNGQRGRKVAEGLDSPLIVQGLATAQVGQPILTLSPFCPVRDPLEC